MRLFRVVRHRDVTGISGTGLVADAVEFTRSKRLAVCWNSQTPSVAIHQNLLSAERVHGHGGATQFKQVQNVLEANGLDSPQPIWLVHKKEGVVFAAAEAVIMPNGWMVMEWLIDPCGVEVFSSWMDFNLVHNTKDYTAIATARQVAEYCIQRDSFFDVASAMPLYRRVQNKVWYKVIDQLEMGSAYSSTYWTGVPTTSCKITQIEIRSNVKLPEGLWNCCSS